MGSRITIKSKETSSQLEPVRNNYVALKNFVWTDQKPKVYCILHNVQLSVKSALLSDNIALWNFKA